MSYKNKTKEKRYNKKWFKENARKRVIYAREYRQKIKTEVLSHYSPKLMCALCGFKDLRALSMDHINGGGTKHLKKIGVSVFYYWLKNNNYPPGFRVLCMNCQFVERERQRKLNGGV